MGQNIQWFFSDILHVAQDWWYQSPVLLTIAAAALLAASIFSLRRT